MVFLGAIGVLFVVVSGLTHTGVLQWIVKKLNHHQHHLPANTPALTRKNPHLHRDGDFFLNQISYTLLALTYGRACLRSVIDASIITLTVSQPFYAGRDPESSCAYAST